MDQLDQSAVWAQSRCCRERECQHLRRDKPKQRLEQVPEFKIAPRAR
jgi:hypothetical protein